MWCSIRFTSARLAFIGAASVEVIANPCLQLQRTIVLEQIPLELDTADSLGRIIPRGTGHYLESTDTGG